MVVQHYKGGLYHIHEVYNSEGVKLLLNKAVGNLKTDAEHTFTHTETGRSITVNETENILNMNEEEEELVYYEDTKGNLWARPYDMFHGTLEYEGKTVRRFTILSKYDAFKKLAQ
ncbi:DUF1653 domain-containing protein [Bacillus sp. Marseille-P3800]|uniref:DUF1653 domain-containing protein n=1 Tax=Bacillus sp. Marseille-P3800 TaxID=2014782 RepID=UPI00159BB502|nr:DUF1653 domain-containing protein [Bacillus sp. Marseille-P3800]